MADILRLSEYLDLPALEQIFETLRTNSQVREAADVPTLVEALYDATIHLPGAPAAWNKLSAELQSRQPDPGSWYAYPGLAARVASQEG